MRQIVQLSTGVTEYALLDATQEELQARGLKFSEPPDDGTWDEAGPIAEAIVELDSGAEVMLVAHVGVPDFGIEVRASDDIEGRSVAEEAARALGIDAARISWVRES